MPYNETHDFSFTKKMINSSEIKRIEEHYNKINSLIDNLSDFLNQVSEFSEAKHSPNDIKKKILWVEHVINEIEEVQKQVSWRDRKDLELLFEHIEEYKDVKLYLEGRLKAAESGLVQV